MDDTKRPISELISSLDSLAEQQHSPNVRELASSQLAAPPSCMAFRPESGDYQILIVGTYELGHGNNDEGERSRYGGLLCLSLRESKVTAVHSEQVEGAVWDLQFHPKRLELFAASTSSGYVYLYTADAHGHMSRSTMVRPVSETAITHLAWHPLQNDKQALSLANGEIWSVRWTSDLKDVQQGSSTKTQEHMIRNAHFSTETIAWCCAWNYQGTLYSGGDDSQLRATSNRADDDGDLERTEQTIKAEAAITSIVPLILSHTTDTFILVGSQDHHMYLYSSSTPSATAPPSEPQHKHLLGSILLPGPIYRMKILDITTEHFNTAPVLIKILISIQQYGVRIVELAFDTTAPPDRGPTMRIIAHIDSLDPEKQLCYAIATTWEIPGAREHAHERLWVMSSFYEKSLRVWRWAD